MSDEQSTQAQLAALHPARGPERLASRTKALRIAFRAHRTRIDVQRYTPVTLLALLDALGQGDDARPGLDRLQWGGMTPGAPLSKPQPLFPRLDQLLG